MIKVLLLDADGLIINKPKMWSQYLIQEYGASKENVIPFFSSPEFDLARVGKADLKEILKPYLTKWNWSGTVDELVNFWCEKENYTDQKFVDFIRNCQAKGIKVYLQSRQEKYRGEYIAKVMGFDKIFDDLLMSYKLGYAKPDLKFWEAIFEQIQPIAKDEVLVWDDKPENIDSAKQFGFLVESYHDFDSFQKTMEKYFEK